MKKIMFLIAIDENKANSLYQKLEYGFSDDCFVTELTNRLSPNTEKELNQLIEEES